MRDANITPLRTIAPPPLVDTECEQALLGALLISNRAYERVAEILRSSDFGSTVHIEMFATLGAMIERGEPANPITIKGAWEPKYPATLAVNAVTISNVPYYAERIADLSRRRALIGDCKETIADAEGPAHDRGIAMVLEAHEQRLLTAQRAREAESTLTIGRAAHTALMSAEAAYKRGGGLAGVPTGLADLDLALGGLLPGDLIIIGARPSMGKTALAAQILKYAAEHKTPGLMFSLEQSAEQLAQRQMAAWSGISTDRQRTGDVTDDGWRKLIEAHSRLSALPLRIDETSGLSVAQIISRARRAKRRDNIGLVVADHLQFIAGKDRTEGRRHDIEDITRGMKTLAKELAIPVILLSQLSRAVELRDDKRPLLADLRESGSIEQDADRVLMIYREEYYLGRSAPMRRPDESDDKFLARQAHYEQRLGDVAGLAEIIIQKDRHGESPRTVKVHWDARRMIFCDRAH